MLRVWKYLIFFRTNIWTVSNLKPKDKETKKREYWLQNINSIKVRITFIFNLLLLRIKSDKSFKYCDS